MDDLDLSEFHDVFFEEADEHLGAMEALLIEAGRGLSSPDQVDAIFRAAHSIKGGAAAFGFQDIADLTHEMETVFDRIRKGARLFDKDVVDAFLVAGDRLRSMFAARKAGTPDDPAGIDALCERLRGLIGEASEVTSPGPAPTSVIAQPVATPHNVPPAQSLQHAAPARCEPAGVAAPAVDEAPRPVAFDAVRAAPALVARTSGGADASSIRVDVQKVDALVNLVGELVITQAMLAQAAETTGTHAALDALLAQLQRNARDLQQSAMSIRMMPMSFAFGRFPRLVRDLAASLGKQVELRTDGESTELDKGLIERIVDPLTHLVRNALDHGIEPSGVRVAAGKAAHGTIGLTAFHRGGCIYVEVSDDGAGLDRERLLAKARERGMTVSDAMSDQEVFQLIFEAGFSTAQTVTDVSGRGVGMDVVRRNIRAMNGNVEIRSVLGQGSCISIRLPLTLAILDGLSVSVGTEVFIVPLTYIVESLQPSVDDVKWIGGRDRVVHVRGEYLPVVALHDVFNLPSAVHDVHRGIVVILESEGRKVALFVDALVGQHQVVIKSLETNYRRVQGVAGATIMGDGRVALILDVPRFVGTTPWDDAQAA